MNAELSRANQVPWDKRLSVVPSRTHAQGAIECDAIHHTNSRNPHALVNTTKGPRELRNIDEEW